MATRQLREARKRLAASQTHQSRWQATVLGSVPVQELDIHALQRYREIQGTLEVPSPTL